LNMKFPGLTIDEYVPDSLNVNLAYSSLTTKLSLREKEKSRIDEILGRGG
jgi:hypothetical protein